ncbi:MAG: hypothetical protein ABT940_02950 [Alphaproteobacteria bacterium]
MDALIRRHLLLFASAVYVVGAVLAAGYTVLYYPKQQQIARAMKFSSLMEQENTKMSKIKEARKAKSSSIGIRSLPEFLERINNIAKDTDVILTKLVPREGNRMAFDLQIAVDYFTFLKFAQRLESLDVTIHDIQIHPYDVSHSPPVHAITFSMTPRNDAEPLSGERLSRLAKQVTEENKRNPFQRFVYNPGVGVRKEIDLTWIYKLSGIGSVGGVRMATIDSREYEVGNKFKDMTIARIDADTVNLTKSTPNGVEKFVIRFRKSK